MKMSTKRVGTEIEDISSKKYEGRKGLVRKKKR